MLPSRQSLGAELGGKGEKIIIVFKITPRDAEEGRSSDKLKDKTAETPYIEGFFDGSSKNQLRGSKAEWSYRPFWWVCKEVC